MDEYPRKLSSFELKALNILLPKDRTAYRPYFEFVLNANVIGEGRWGSDDLVLSHELSEIDRTAGMRPVVAFGEFVLSDGRKISLSTHEIEDGQLEAQFSENVSEIDASTLLSSWTYSTWSPNAADPNTTTPPRTVELKDAAGIAQFVLAISPHHRAVWVYHRATEFNQLLPVTGFYEYLLRSKPLTGKQTQFSPKSLFTNVNEFSDTDLREALLHYNQENRKFDASEILLRSAKKRAAFLKLFDKVFKRSNG